MRLGSLCSDCNVPLTARRENHARQWCPCCSSRWDVGMQRHWGSHNDWGVYLCDRTLSGWIRRLLWRHVGIVLDNHWRRDRHVTE